MTALTKGGRLPSCVASLAVLLLVLVGCGAPEGSAEGADSRQEAVSDASRLRDLGGNGPYAVGSAEMIFTDPARAAPGGGTGRPIHVVVWYPVDDEAVASAATLSTYPVFTYGDETVRVGSAAFEAIGAPRTYREATPSKHKPFPLIMFSAGLGGDAIQYAILGMRFASHGFAVAMVTHRGDPLFRWQGEIDPFAVTWGNRSRDISSALTNLLESAATGGKFSQLFDPQRVAAAGHSFGGATAMALAAGDDDTCDAFASWGEAVPPEACFTLAPDPRIRAVVNIDGTSEVLQMSEYARIRVPTLIIGESEATFAWADTAGYLARTHAATRSAVNLRVDIERVNHWSFGNLCTLFDVYTDLGLWRPQMDDAKAFYCGEPNVWLPEGDALRSGVEANEIASRYILAFLQTHLAGNTGYTPILTKGWACARESGVHFFTSEAGGKVHFGPGAWWLDPTWLDEFDYRAVQNCAE